MEHQTTASPSFDESLAMREAWRKHCIAVLICGSPAENCNLSGASGGAHGQGTRSPSKKSNLDSTGCALVRKGSKIEYPSGFTGRVARVRLGVLWVDLGKSAALSFHTCASVRVIG